MKDNVVSGILKSRVQDIRTDSISDKAFEQVILPSMQPTCRFCVRFLPPESGLVDASITWPSQQIGNDRKQSRLSAV